MVKRRHELPALVVPVPNLNGNTAEDLIKRLRGVLDATQKLSEAMGQACDICHGRNFQTLDDGEARRLEAQEAWGQRISMIGALHEDVLDLAVEIQKSRTR